MDVIGTEVNFNTLAMDIGVEVEILPMLFDALKRECDRVFPMLTNAISLQDFTQMHEYSHALKGIVGNMRLDDLYAIATSFDNAAKSEDQTYLYEDTLSILRDQLDTLFKSFYSQES